MKRMAHLVKAVVLLFLLLLISGVACTGVSPPTSTTPAETATVTVAPTATATPTLAPSPVPPTHTPTSTSTPAPLSPAAIFDRVAPSVAFIDTGLHAGSAILVEGGYLLTNAHVVWPFRQVRAVFSDGTELSAVPLVNWDPVLDLAVLGPLDTLPAPALALHDGEASAVGSDVYLVGYPGEVDAFPKPTITRGLISRVREWETESITFFQSDATVAGGQSGGALVSEMGDVIGLSGFSFAYGEFALVASAGDLAERVEGLIASDGAESQQRSLPDPNTAAAEQSVTLRFSGDEAVFLITGDCGPRITVEADSLNNIALQLLPLGTGELVEVNQTFSGVEHLSHAINDDELYMLAVYQFDDEPSDVHVQSTCDLSRVGDEDGEPELSLTESRRGTLNYPGDVDRFQLTLDEGQIVSFVVDAVAIDPFLRVTYPEGRPDSYVEDDDSGGGLFSTNAGLTFRAPHSGSFIVHVHDAYGDGIGGYSLTVGGSLAGAPTPVSMPPTPVAITTDFGEMQLYESSRYAFTMQVPAAWDDVTEQLEGCVHTCFSGDEALLIIAEENAAATLRVEEGTVTRQQYVDLVFQSNVLSFPAATLLWRTTQTTDSGLTVDVAHYRVSRAGHTVHIKSVVAFEDGIGFNALYFVSDVHFSGLEAAIDYSFRTVGRDG